MGKTHNNTKTTLNKDLEPCPINHERLPASHELGRLGNGHPLPELPCQLNLRPPQTEPPCCLGDECLRHRTSGNLVPLPLKKGTSMIEVFSLKTFRSELNQLPQELKYSCYAPRQITQSLCMSSVVIKQGHGGTHFLKILFSIDMCYKQLAPKGKKS